MALANCLYGTFLRDALNNAAAFDLSDDTVKWQTTGDAYTPDPENDEDTGDLTDEITGTGYTTGGEVLASPDWAIDGDYVRFDGDDVSLTGTTLTGVHGIITFDDTVADRLIHCHDFDQDYDTISGPFIIQWDTDGIWRFGVYP